MGYEVFGISDQSPFESGLGFVEVVLRQLDVGEITRIEAIVGTQAEGLAYFLNGFVELSQQYVGVAQIAVRHYVARVRLLPHLINLERLLQVAFDNIVVMARNIEPFALAGPLPPLKRFLRVCRSQVIFS